MSDSFTDEFVAGGPEKQPGSSNGTDALMNQVIALLMEIYDPEIPVNIYELGLIYDVETGDSGRVKVTMTLTTPMCPVADTMPLEIETKIRALDGVGDVEIDLVWEPPWDMSMLSDAAKLELGMM